MIEDIKGKKVVVSVFHNNGKMQKMSARLPDASCFYEGIVKNCSSIGLDTFLILDNNIMINTKYIQTIEIIN